MVRDVSWSKAWLYTHQIRGKKGKRIQTGLNHEKRVKKKTNLGLPWTHINQKKQVHIRPSLCSLFQSSFLQHIHFRIDM